MFERFTDRARRVLVLAQEEARLLDHSFIGTEHILLGLLREDEGIAAEALRALGISLEGARLVVEEMIGRSGTPSTGSPPFTPRTKKVLELSLREAMQLGDSEIGTEHLLLGLVREGEGVAARVLQNLGADLPRVRQQVMQLLSGHGGDLSTKGHRPEPSCSRCRSLLSDDARYRRITISPDTADPDHGPRSIEVVYCGRCGTTFGMFTIDQSGDDPPD
jgi:ATP-dependent Clp protease ATP-binding subunit ClpC